MVFRPSIHVVISTTNCTPFQTWVTHNLIEWILRKKNQCQKIFVETSLKRRRKKKIPLDPTLAKSSLLFFRNVLSLSMLTAIRSNLLHNVDCDLRVIILSANGGVFSSGHDLKELVRQLVVVTVVWSWHNAPCL